MVHDRNQMVMLPRVVVCDEARWRLKEIENDFISQHGIAVLTGGDRRKEFSSSQPVQDVTVEVMSVIQPMLRRDLKFPSSSWIFMCCNTLIVFLPAPCTISMPDYHGPFPSANTTLPLN
eukprot:Lithocolla_globosa_v1_NODE_6911_length_1017_cov_1.828482.p1 type:complete len:119 gc:universal NODE_6911_length_1017_cov_1.828482:486-130(-)